jgi:chemotaxis protein MotA
MPSARSVRRTLVPLTIFGLATFLLALAATTGFLDPISLLVTVGGALAVARLTHSGERWRVARRHLQAALRDDTDPEALIACLKQLARAYRTGGAPDLERAGASAPDPFLARAVGLMLELVDTADQGDARLLEEALVAEARVRVAEIDAARQVLVTLGRLFPAFGLIGTLIGLALLLRNLGGADLAAIGPGLGMAVLTTLYGAVVANVVVLPLVTKLQVHLARQTLRMQMVIEGMLLVERREYPSRVERVLRIYVGRPAAAAAPAVAPLVLAEHAA